MSPFWWGLILGLVVGANVGLLTFGLLTAAKHADAHLDPVTRRQAAAEQEFWEAQHRANPDWEEHA